MPAVVLHTHWLCGSDRVSAACRSLTGAPLQSQDLSPVLSQTLKGIPAPASRAVQCPCGVRALCLGSPRLASLGGSVCPWPPSWQPTEWGLVPLTHSLPDPSCPAGVGQPPPRPVGRRLVWLTWDSQPAPLPPGTVRPHRRGSPVRGNHCRPEAEAGAGTVGLGSGQEGWEDTSHHWGPWLPADFPAGFLAQGW